jgi:hypothetical protein
MLKSKVTKLEPKGFRRVFDVGGPASKLLGSPPNPKTIKLPLKTFLTLLNLLMVLQPLDLLSDPVGLWSLTSPHQRALSEVSSIFADSISPPWA